MLLASTANHLYWMSRYMERAESIARILAAAHRIASIPQIVPEQTNEWESALAASACLDLFNEREIEANAENVYAFMVFDATNPSSIFSCIEQARTNARIVRAALTTDTWEAINSAWMEMQRYATNDYSQRTVNRMIDWAQDVSLRVAGSQFRNMLRNDAYWFSRLGMYFERADNTARILDVKYHVLLPSHDQVGGGRDYYQWAALLRSVSALTAYHWVYRQSVKPALVADLLILREEMPRSIASCYANITNCLDELADVHGRQGPSQRAARSLYAKLGNTNTDKIIDTGLHEVLSGLITENNRIGQTVIEQYYLH